MFTNFCRVDDVHIIDADGTLIVMTSSQYMYKQNIIDSILNLKYWPIV